MFVLTSRVKSVTTSLKLQTSVASKTKNVRHLVEAKVDSAIWIRVQIQGAKINLTVDYKCL